MATHPIQFDSVTNSAESATNQIPVYVIDDSRDQRRSLHFLLSTSQITAWPFSAADDFLDEVSALTPGAILLDIRMPGMDGLQMMKALRQNRIDWPVIAMTAHGDISVAVQAMKLGAVEFLEKPFTPEMLDDALKLAFSLLQRTRVCVRAQTEAANLFQSLSRREAEIVLALTEGLSNKAVAHRLALSTRTVEWHRSNAMAKLGAKNIAEAIAVITAARGSEI